MDLENAAKLAFICKIGFDTAENEPQKELSTRLLFFLPSRAKPNSQFKGAGSRLVCAALPSAGRWRASAPRRAAPLGSARAYGGALRLFMASLSKSLESPNEQH